MKKKLLSVLLALCMVATLLPGTALAAEFNDVDGHWGKEAIERWADYGVLNGKGNGVFDPNGVMTRAEFAQMLVNMMGYTKTSTKTFSDLNPNAWYADAISKLEAAGVMNGVGGGKIDPLGQITREQAAVMLCRAFGIKASASGTIAFQDSGKVSSWAKDAMIALSERGMINGVGNNTLSPDGIVNRATAAKLTSNMVAEYVTSDKVLTGEIKGVVIVARGAKVEIKDATVSAPIVVESASVSLTNTKAEEVKVAGEKAAVSADKDSTVTDVSIGGEATAVEINGKVEGTVTVEEGATAPEIKGDGVKADQVVNNTDADVTVNGETVKPEDKPETPSTSDSGSSGSGSGSGTKPPSGSEGETPVDPPQDVTPPEANTPDQTTGRPEDTAPTAEEEAEKINAETHPSHNYVVDENDSRAKAATCTQFGVEVLKCTCGLEKVNNLDKADHEPKDTKNATESVAATCASTGYDSFDCKNCSAKGVKITATEATGAHTYSKGWVQGEAGESLVHYHQCTVCGEPDEDTAADCSVKTWYKNDNSTHKGVCSVCNRSMTEDHTPSDGDPVYGKNGDCTRGVSASATCKVCGYKDSWTIDATEGHDFGDNPEVGAGCQNEGCTVKYTKPAPTCCKVEGCECTKDDDGKCVICDACNNAKCQACGWTDPCAEGHSWKNDGSGKCNNCDAECQHENGYNESHQCKDCTKEHASGTSHTYSKTGNHKCSICEATHTCADTDFSTDGNGCGECGAAHTGATHVANTDNENKCDVCGVVVGQ